MGWCVVPEIDKVFDSCPHYFHVCQYLYGTNNSGFWEMDDVVWMYDVWWFSKQQKVSKVNKNGAAHVMHMHTEPQQLISSLTFNRCSSWVVSDEESQTTGAQTLITWAFRCNAEPSLWSRDILEWRFALLLLPAPRRGHGKLAPCSVSCYGRVGFRYTCGSCASH